jgi:hypothetical protein
MSGPPRCVGSGDPEIKRPKSWVPGVPNDSGAPAALGRGVGFGPVEKRPGRGRAPWRDGAYASPRGTGDDGRPDDARSEAVAAAPPKAAAATSPVAVSRAVIRASHHVFAVAGARLRHRSAAIAPSPAAVIRGAEPLRRGFGQATGAVTEGPLRVKKNARREVPAAAGFRPLPPRGRRPPDLFHGIIQPPPPPRPLWPFRLAASAPATTELARSSPSAELVPWAHSCCTFPAG